MNAEFVKSLAIKVVIILLTALGGYLHQNYGAGDISALATDLVNAAFTVYSLYRVTNMKLVPKHSIAVSPDDVQNSKTAVASGTAMIPKDVVKVVGAILIAFLILLPRESFAQTKPGACNIQTLFVGVSPSNFLTKLGACGSADFQAALDDANSSPIDNIAIACLAPATAVVKSIEAAQNSGASGLITAFQKFRRAKQSGIVGACQAYINTTLLLQ